MEVQIPPIRFSPGSMVVHHDFSRGKSISPEGGADSSSVSRRLGHKVTVQTSPPETIAMATRLVQQSGVPNKLREVGTDPSQRFRLCGISLRNKYAQGVPYRETNSSYPRHGPTILERGSKLGSCVDITSGVALINRETGSLGQTAYEGIAVLPKNPVVSERTGYVQMGKDDPSSKISSAVVDAGQPSQNRLSSTLPNSTVPGFLRCFHGGMGCPYGHEPNLGKMDRRTVQVSHKPAGIDCGALSSPPLGGNPQKQCSVGSNGQLDCRCLYQQARGYSVQNNVSGGYKSVDLGSQEEYSLNCPTHTREAECACRFALQRWTDTTNRMVSVTNNIQETLQRIHHTLDRPICNTVEQETGQLCVSNSRQPGSSDRCTVNVMEGNVGLCIPSNTHSDESVEQNHIRSMQNDANSTCVSNSKLVSSSPKSTNRRASGLASHKGHAQAAKSRNLPYKSRKAPTTRLDIVREAVRTKGFSEEVAKCIAEPVRGSTSAVYDSKWSIFSAWCQSRKINPSKASVQDVTEFLLEKKKGGLATRTLESYRSAINSTLKHTTGQDLANNMEISALIKNFNQSSLRTRNAPPKWSLSLVLNMLRGPPFEPMIKAQLKYVTFKTVFLLSLAAGRRRSEIHAIEKKSLSWTEDKSHITCRLVPQFVAKTQLANDGRSLHSFRIESLGNFVSKDREEMKLCPVRATFMYLERTKDMRTGKQLLFVSYKQGFTKEIAKATISSWLKKTISMAYANAADEDFKLADVKAHQVRAMAASMAYYNKSSIHEVMDACTWKCHNTFTSFYLNNLSEQMGEMLTLTPFVAGQSVVS